jgi:hypothetical protein
MGVLLDSIFEKEKEAPFHVRSRTLQLKDAEDEILFWRISNVVHIDDDVPLVSPNYQSLPYFANTLRIEMQEQGGFVEVEALQSVAEIEGLNDIANKKNKGVMENQIPFGESSSSASA